MIKVDIAEQKLLGVLRLPSNHVRPLPGSSGRSNAARHGRRGARSMADIRASIMTGGPMPQDVKVSSADGKVLCLTGRYDREVYAFDTSDGKLLARIKVGKEPHGLASIRSPAATHSATPASSAEGRSPRGELNTGRRLMIVGAT